MVTRRSTTSRRLSPSGLPTLVRSHGRARTVSALESPFSTHCERNADTAQGYRNEEEAGKAIRDSGLARKDIYITTKFSGRDDLTIEEAIHASLSNVRIHFAGTLDMRLTKLCGCSWVWSMSTCTLFMLPATPSQTFLPLGRSWRNSKPRDSPKVSA